MAGKGEKKLRLTAITHGLNLPDMRTLLKLQSSSTDVFFGFLRLLIWWVFHCGPQFLVVHELARAVFGEGAENKRSYFWCSWLVRHAKESLGSFPATVSQITQVLKAFSLFVTTLILMPIVSHGCAFLIFFILHHIKDFASNKQTLRVYTASTVTEKGPIFISIAHHSELFSESRVICISLGFIPPTRKPTSNATMWSMCSGGKSHTFWPC